MYNIILKMAKEWKILRCDLRSMIACMDHLMKNKGQGDSIV